MTEYTDKGDAAGFNGVAEKIQLQVTRSRFPVSDGDVRFSRLLGCARVRLQGPERDAEPAHAVPGR